ncbi:sigma-54-dependent Fis family transcriptional regulator [Cupriavidus sp. HPC(L)]|uniref:sigma-54 interaction domain-containing protein n=1 Tax=Cupriavidus sp. HPC(L) TaxID=1217418 RepID=UPI0020A0E7B7|nr:sigma 54-interacting transcriptional regulator [Cupriavidus sp. HPC(L)]
MSSLKTPIGTSAPVPDALGALVIDRDGRVAAATGIARDDTLAGAALAALAQATDFDTARAGRPSTDEVAGTRPYLFEVAAPGAEATRHIALALDDGTTTLVLLHRPGSATALFDFLGAVPFAGAILEHFITNPYQAITVADRDGRMRYISPVHERFLGLRTGEGIGQPAERVIPNSRLPQVAATGKAEIGQLQRMNGVTRVVNRIPIVQRGEVVGAIGQVLFKEPEAIARMHKEVSELRSQVAHYRRALDDLRGGPGRLIGDSAPMQRLRREIETVARLDVPVLILGESGTGKELVARAIHEASQRDGGDTRDGKPLVSLNLAALPATLIESELFGHAAGAFTGSRRQGQAGKLEQAAGGTLFLDEVADIPMEMQVKLLRVLEDHLVERIGSRQARRIDFRLVAATNRDIQALIDAGRFRLDLYYRLSGVVLRIPALRQRREDIPALLHHFVQAFCQRNNVPVPAIDSAVPRHLAERPWPGNIRQLRQKIEEALVFCDGGRLRVADFARGDEAAAAALAADATPYPLARSYAEHELEDDPRSGTPPPVAITPASRSSGLRELAYEAALKAIADHGGNKKRAAQALGISRSHLYTLLARGTGDGANR